MVLNERVALLAALCAAIPAPAAAFVSSPRCTTGSSHHIRRHASSGKSDADEGCAPLSQSEADSYDGSSLTELSPPLINWERRSLLFDESVRDDDVAAAADRATLDETIQKATGAADEAFLAMWRGAAVSLPGIVTGFRRDSSDVGEEVDDGAAAAGRLYNIFFVRVPTIVAGLFYAKNLVCGLPLIVDVGGGPFEVPLPVVMATLWAILRF